MVRLLKTVLNGPSGLPDGYTEVEYLKASGAQYIDTDIDGKSGVRAEIGFEWGTEDIGNDRYVLAAADGYYGRCYFGTYQSKWMYGYSSYYQAGTPVADTYYKAEVSWELGNQYMKINGETLYTGENTSTLDVRWKLFLFARNQGGASWFSYAKIYYCKMWENGVLVRDYIPCLDPNNKPCMYDKISGTPFYNPRTDVADFTYGRKIIPVEYVESDGTNWIDTGVKPYQDVGCRIGYKVTGRYQSQADSNIIMCGNDSWRWGFGYRINGDTLQISGLCISGATWINYYVGTPVFSDVEYNYYNDYRFFWNGVLLREDIPHETQASNGNIWLFTSNNGGNDTSWRPGILRCYFLKMTKAGVLIKDFIPCRDENNIGYMFDKLAHRCHLKGGSSELNIGSDKKLVTTRFIKDGGSDKKTRLLNNNWLFDNYEIGEYIESSGTQYIDTGVNVNDDNKYNWRFKVKRYTSSTGGWRLDGSATMGIDAIYVGIRDSGIFVYGIGNDSNTNVAASLNVPYIYDLNIPSNYYKITQENGTDVVNITELLKGTDFNSTGLNLWLFGYSGEGRKYAGRIYFASIYNNGVLVRNFLPVKRKSDNAIGMIDLVTKQFYGNSGTGSFVFQPKG
ncbi:MAG: hypothetical protein J6S67_10060 [Methanobrevibacter sp.]|nr:hypothetical protein [Methanobrevibacter sp.]